MRAEKAELNNPSALIKITDNEQRLLRGSGITSEGSQMCKLFFFLAESGKHTLAITNFCKRKVEEASV